MQPDFRAKIKYDVVTATKFLSLISFMKTQGSREDPGDHRRLAQKTYPVCVSPGLNVQRSSTACPGAWWETPDLGSRWLERLTGPGRGGPWRAGGASGDWRGRKRSLRGGWSWLYWGQGRMAGGGAHPDRQIWEEREREFGSNLRILKDNGSLDRKIRNLHRLLAHSYPLAALGRLTLEGAGFGGTRGWGAGLHERRIQSE